MRVVELVGAVALQAVGEAAAVDVGRYAIENKVADRVRNEMQRAIAGKGRQLQIQPVDRFLQCDHAEGVLFRLVLIERRRIEIADPKCSELWRLPRIVRNLKVASEVAEDRCKTCLRVEHGRRITEEVALIRPVVDRVVAVGRILDAEIAGEAEARDKVLGIASATAVFEARTYRAETAAVDADAAALLQRIAARGLDIDDAGGAQAELRGQRTGNQREAADKIGAENTAEARNTIREGDAVDAVLHIGVLIAYVDVAIDGAILRNAGRLQQDGVEWRVGARGQCFDERSVHVEGAGAETRRKIVPRNVELRVLSSKSGVAVGLRRRSSA